MIYLTAKLKKLLKIIQRFMNLDLKKMSTINYHQIFFTLKKFEFFLKN
jgi:hypothetical protein